MSFKSLGLFRKSRLVRMSFIITDLPEPVCPATSKCGIRAKSAMTECPTMSFPMANVSAPFDSVHSRDWKIELNRTVAPFTFGTSIPTARLPGIGASMRMVVAARSSARLFSRAVILVSFTPVGGRSVYCVTRGPMFAPSISTSMAKLAKVSFIIRAFPSTFPASALSCFWSSKSMLGSFQSGSLAVVSASWLSVVLSFCAVFLKLEWCTCSFANEPSLCFTTGTPSFSWKPLSAALAFSAASSPSGSSPSGRRNS